MATDIYRALKDVSIPRAVAKLGEDIEGRDVYQTEGHTYAEGDPVYAQDITPELRKQAENGDLSDFLEPASEDDFEEFLLPKVAPEHELERLAFEEHGRETLTPEEIIERNTHNLEEDKSAIEEGKDSGADKRNLFLAKKDDDGSDGAEQPKKKAKPTKRETASDADGSQG
jgi:hypothetical protein